MNKEQFYNEIKSYKLLANKSLGQNFLIDPSVCEKIINSLSLKKEDNLLEIGAGLGSLSYFLIDKPKKAKTDIPYYTPEEVEKLISVLQLEPIKYQAIILLALDLGCRRGELTGLTWEDIDFETGRVQINKTTQYAYGEIFEKGTKTANSERVNYISQTTIEILKRWQKEQLKQKLLLGSKWQGSKRVFTTDYGADIHPDTPTKILGKIINKYSLKKITFHGLRHTNVTLMIAKGIQTQIISRKVGHSSVQTTDRVYSHFFEDEFKNVPNVMEEFLTVKAN